MDTLFTTQTLKTYAQIYQQITEGKEIINDEEVVADTIRLHPEFDPFWPDGESAIHPQEIDDYVVNPLIHTGLHVIVEKQILDKNPEEVDSTLNTLLANGISRHDAMHQIIGLWGELYFRSVRQSSSLYEWEYIELLNRLAEQNK